jgi:hypothetical protein
VLTQSLIWKQLDRNHGRDANQCRRGREKDWGRLADLGVRPHQWVHQSASVFRVFHSLSEYFVILVTINRDAQWNQSDSVWDRVLNFENFLKAITLSCIYE